MGAYNRARCALHSFDSVTLGKDWPLEQFPGLKISTRPPVALSRGGVQQLFAAFAG